VQKRILPVAVIATTLISIIGWNCTKLDTTDIGSDLLPAVDNVNTFDTTLLINSTQANYFSDSTYISKYDDYALGGINNDPLFGTTSANIFMQLKPAFYPFFFGNAADTLNGPGLGIDSVVLCLKYKGFWGDSTLPVNLQVKEVVDAKLRDSVLKDNKTNVSFFTGSVLGNAVINPLTADNYVKYNYNRDSIKSQIRIKITNTTWVNALFNRDSVSGNTTNNAFYNDSTYRFFYNGLAVLSTGGGSNGLLYASLADTSTKLEIYYRKKAKGSTVTDSVYTSFRLNPLATATSAASGTSNYIVRNRAGYRISNPASTEHFLQTSPGSFINLNIPGLAALSNRIIHRAEIIIDQIPTDPILDEKLSAPNFLFLDLKDTGSTDKWKPVYFDLNTAVAYDPDYKNGSFFVPSDGRGGVNVNFPYFGGYRRTKPDPLTGGQIRYYNFNISRYVQQIVTSHTRSYDLRLYAPFNLIYPQYSQAYFAYGNNIAFGRVRIGSGSNPNYRMKLRIVYSKL
jgi:hypothetical protein